MRRTIKSAHENDHTDKPTETLSTSGLRSQDAIFLSQITRHTHHESIHESFFCNFERNAACARSKDNVRTLFGGNVMCVFFVEYIYYNKNFIAVEWDS